MSDSAERYFVITFFSVHHAMAFEDEMKQTNLNFKLIPVPRQISESCGAAAKVWDISEDDLIKLLNQHTINFSGLYLFENSGTAPTCIISKEKQDTSS
jgi:hypothetical protein